MSWVDIERQKHSKLGNLEKVYIEQIMEARKSANIPQWKPQSTTYIWNGFVIRQNLLQSVMEFKWICLLYKAEGKIYNNSLLPVHTPTEEKDDTNKYTFYDQHERVYSTILKQDMVLILGDFKSRKKVFSPTIEKFNLHGQCNDNVLCLVDFATTNSLLIKSTMFEHKNVQQPAVDSNDAVRRNQIDHILVYAKHASNILDVKPSRTGCT